MRFAPARLLSSLDDFGHPIRLTYKGEETYQTACGGALSVAVQVITLIMTVIALTEVIEMKDPKITSYARPLSASDRDELGDLNFEDFDYMMGFSVKILNF